MVKKPNNIPEAEELIKSANRIAVISHIAPDGDAVGSLLGFYHKVRSLGKFVRPYLFDGVPDVFRYLPGSEEIVSAVPEGEEPYDLLVMLDLSDENRLGDVWADIRALSPDAKLIVFDHHVTASEIGVVNVIDTSAAATAEILYFLFENILPQEAAQALLNGIMTDTGFMAYENTKPRTVEVVIRLIEAGASPHLVRQELNRWRRRGKVWLWGFGLRRAKVVAGGKAVVSYILREDYQKTDTKEEDIAGLVSMLRSPAGVYVSALLSEPLDPAKNEVRISFRSKAPVVVHTIARQFGGGGHPRAAGARVDGRPLNEVLSEVVTTLEKELSGYELD